MLSWIPLIGPILQGLFSTASSIYATFKNTEVEEVKASADIIRATQDDIGLRILRDAALVFPVLWSAIIGWDTIVAYHWPSLMYNVPDYPENVRYIPYGAFAFLFGLLGFKIWKGRI